MLVHRRVTPSIKFASVHLYTWVERGTVRVKCLAQEHNTMSPARARTRTARSGDERTNHEATAPPTVEDVRPRNSAQQMFQRCIICNLNLHTFCDRVTHGWLIATIWLVRFIILISARYSNFICIRSYKAPPRLRQRNLKTEVSL